jgi:hypothetical protein
LGHPPQRARRRRRGRRRRVASRRRGGGLKRPWRSQGGHNSTDRGPADRQT